MSKINVWEKAQKVELQVTEDILPVLDIGFDEKVSTETQKELCNFVKWLENNYRFPITLWVDFEYKHYLIRHNGKRVGYLFYWSDFSSYPVFDNKDDIPQIRLPVRTEHSTIEEIFCSFIQAVTDYYAWICNDINNEYNLNDNDTEEILQAYLNSKI